MSRRIEPVAVVGIAGRFPDSDSPDELWTHLAEGRVCVTELPASSGAGSDWIGKAYQVRAPETFDRHLFGMTAGEVRSTDPQHRLLLTLSHEVLQDAAIDPGRCPGDVGVYVSSNMSRIYYQPGAQGAERDDASALALAVGNDADHLATRIAYQLGLTGPSLTVQSGCSSALMATHVACQALRAGEVTLALAGGVCLRFPRDAGWVHDPDLIRSEDGYCRPFDHRSTGSVPGEGGALVALRLLSDAVRDGDHIYGCLLASAAGNDGDHRAGYLAPGVEGQQRVIERALDLAQVNARSIGMAEAHGSGTALGDPIEFAALTAAHRKAGADRQYCALGSVKANIGHLNAAAGIAGLVKCLLAVDHGVIPAMPTYEAPNEHIDVVDSPFYLPNRSVPWPGPARRRIAEVSSFGLGGANVHMVVSHRDYPAPIPSAPVPAPDVADVRWPAPWLFPVSASSTTSLRATAAAVASALTDSDAPVPETSRTLARGRRQLPLRRCAVGADHKDVADELLRLASEDRLPATRRPGVAFLFPDAGPRILAVGAGLWEASTGFREHTEQCAKMLSSFTEDHDVVAALQDADAVRHPVTMLLAASFTVQTGLAKWFEALHLTPDLVLGMGAGEVAAAHIAGSLDLAGAMALLVERADRLDSAVPGVGVLVACDASVASQITADLARPVEVRDREVVLAVEAGVAGTLEGRLERQGIEFTRLPGPVPVLSGNREHPGSDRFAGVAPTVPFVSARTAAPVSADELVSGAHWTAWEGADRPMAAMAHVAARATFLVDFGTADSLSRFAPERATTVQALDGAGGDPLLAVGGVLARAWETGVAVDLPGAGVGRRVRLPGYVYDLHDYAPEVPAVVPSAPAPSEPVPSADVEGQVTAALEAVMGIDLNPDDDLFQLGLDSLLATQVINRLKKDGITARVRDLFEAPSIRGFVDHLRSEVAR